KLERGHRKVPACGGLRLVDTGRAEGDDVGSGVRAYVRELARIGVVAAPTAGAGTEGSKLERGRLEVRRPVHGLVIESQALHIAERVGAVWAGDTDAVAVEPNERVLRTKSRKDCGVAPGHAVDGVVAAAANQRVVAAVARERVIERAADHAFDAAENVV